MANSGLFRIERIKASYKSILLTLSLKQVKRTVQVITKQHIMYARFPPLSTFPYLRDTEPNRECYRHPL
jgi:hypothetical protein